MPLTPEPPRPLSVRRSGVTLALVAVNVAAFAWLVAPASVDEGDLVRAGALFRPAVLAGEWWRALTAMFLHAGWLHLGLNMYGLFLLGRFAEGVLGKARYLVVYVASGLCGAAASTAVGAGALSVGASGAIMGLCGGLIVTLVLRRGAWPEAWRRTLLVNLTFLGALQIFIGFQVPMIDNATHVGGMVGGAGTTLLMAPGGLLASSPSGRLFARISAALCAAVILAAAAFAALSPLPRTLARLPLRQVTLGDTQISIPEHWEVDAAHSRIEDPWLGIQATLERDHGRVTLESPQANDPRYRALLERIYNRP